MPMVDEVNFNGELFHCYLLNSKGVYVNGVMSSLLLFISGVPQGSVLRRFHFVLCIINLSNTIPSAVKCLLYGVFMLFFSHSSCM